MAKFPYVWVRAFGNGGEGEVIVVELRRGPEFAGWDGREQGKRECDDHGWPSLPKASRVKCLFHQTPRTVIRSAIIRCTAEEKKKLLPLKSVTQELSYHLEFFILDWKWLTETSVKALTTI